MELSCELEISKIIFRIDNVIQAIGLSFVGREDSPMIGADVGVEKSFELSLGTRIFSTAGCHISSSNRIHCLARRIYHPNMGHDAGGSIHHWLAVFNFTRYYQVESCCVIIVASGDVLTYPSGRVSELFGPSNIQDMDYTLLPPWTSKDGVSLTGFVTWSDTRLRGLQVCPFFRTTAI